MSTGITGFGILFSFASLAVLCAFSQIVGASESKTSKRPNILLLLADDLGYGELGSYGQKDIRTPRLDALAKGGLRFTDFYSGTAVCSPSRASLLTGKDSGNATIRGNKGYLGDYKWDRVPLFKDETTIAQMLSDSGYETAFIGKWHLGDPNDLDTWAFARGFDFAVQPQWSSLFEGETYDEDVHYFGNKERSLTYDAEENDCIDSFRTDIILDYFEDRSWEKPLFLFMSYRTPHTREKYIRDREMYADRDWEETERRHAARITMLDTQVGRLLDDLRERGELENTLVLFTSDNGPHSEGEHDYRFFNSSGGLKGYKRDLYEGGIRVPMIAYWEGRIEGGGTTNHQAAFCDIAPTLAEVGLAESGADMRGLSFLPELLGQEQDEPDYLYWELQLDGWARVMPDGGFRQAIRVGDWKGVRYGASSPLELYNLTEDPGERRDLAALYPEIATDLIRLMHKARSENELFPYGGVPQGFRARDRWEAENNEKKNS
ncbi:sulfatase-like hydrolase/transferase [Pelagicoccus mobilis]|uniref:Sulfatase-like hydrolase/transferase n=1 Tax=Pelagicoccus mobilis TaxID=415221 RepID=A0A934RS46_9BACT|nr:sulfatase-like hydrolase/transferase [Pelagicoccus mobilis]MBK1875867.1 sulfatase-like hydrolase/transferase [Pelagicoccus mobilis]